MPAIDTRELGEALAALARGMSTDPFAVLGPHRADDERVVIRAIQPAAKSVEVRLPATGQLVPMTRRDDGPIFEGMLESAGEIPDYRLRIVFAGGYTIELDDPYRYGRVLGDLAR